MSTQKKSALSQKAKNTPEKLVSRRLETEAAAKEIESRASLVKSTVERLERAQVVTQELLQLEVSI